ncbi:hypothetical protein FOZ62_020674 [Perkinsus olseni]|uniref:K Homology domain-containing protein n=1 Tax=Perkinsus olseni TaxID=32597 RepID=A0A7J6SS97_PEROL|nr:hypothetical protein FOZ62_020674 [Perkinsus olseni]
MICRFLDSLHKQLAKYTIKQIELRSDEMGILIGPKGRNIRRITEESLCHDIRVGEDQIVSRSAPSTSRAVFFRLLILSYIVIEW